MQSKYGKGFDLIVQDIINKNSETPRKIKKYIHKIDIIFKGSSRIETTNMLFKFYLEDIKDNFKGIIKGVIIDCLKRTVRSKIYKL